LAPFNFLLFPKNKVFGWQINGNWWRSERNIYGLVKWSGWQLIWQMDQACTMSEQMPEPQSGLCTKINISCI
jgi:hypothetical protein